MPDQKGTVEQLLTHLANALAPLKDELTPALLQDVGIGIPGAWDAQLEGAFARVSTVAGALPPAAAELEAAVAAGGAVGIIAKGVALGTRVVELATSGKQLADAISAAANGDVTLTAAQKARFTSTAAKLFPRLTELMLVRALEDKLPRLAAILDLTGTMTSTPLPGAAGEDATEPPHVSRGFDLNRVVKLFQDPKGLARDLYGWGDPAFDGRALLTKAQRFFDKFELPALLVEEPGQPPILEVLLLSMQANGSVSPPGLGLELRVPATEEVDRSFELPKPWALQVKFKGAYAAGLQALLQANGDFKAKPPSGSVDIDGSVVMFAERAGGPMQLIGLPGGTRLEVGKVSGGIALKAALDSGSGTAEISPALTIGLDRLKLTLSLDGADGFLKNAIAADSCAAEFSIAGRLTPDGFAVTGSGRIEVLLPTHVVLGPLEIQSVCFAARLFDPDPITLELSAGLKFSLGPLTAVVERMGAAGSFRFPPGADGNAGPVQFDLRFKPPEGVGLSLDAGAVKGGGYLFFDFDRHEYAGVMQLNVLEVVSVTAIGLISTRMPDGSDGFSLLVIISVEFNPGIQLGLGFTLVGLGGIVGLNRTMLLEPLMLGVKTGTINSIMFPQGDVIANAPRIISDLRAIFPPYEGKFLIGPMAKLGWGTPTLVSVSLGVIIEIPGNVAIIGVLRLNLPAPDAPLILVQVAFAGAIEFDRKRLFFFAALFESRIVFIPLDGGMGLLAGWGPDSTFVFTVGGFHPRFVPPPLPFPSPARVSMTVLNTPTASVRLDAYLAVTSNTAQVGAQAQIRFGFDDFGIKGHLGFDALFQFSPFYFVIDANVSLSLDIFGMGLMSVRVDLNLRGPTPWRARGTGHVSFLFFSFSADFDVTWGDRAETTLPPIVIVPLLKAELDKRENWTASLPAGNRLLVSLRGGAETASELVMHPLGAVRVSQRLLPLGLHLDKIGTQKPADAKRFELLVTGGGLSAVGPATEKFAMAQFVDLDDAAKLSRPSFEPGDGGLELSASGAQLRTSHMARRVVRYEVILIDGEFRLHQKKSSFSTGLFAHHLRGAVITTSALSDAYQKKLDPFVGVDKVTVAGDAYTIADSDTNKPFSGAAKTFASEAAARDHLATMAAADPAGAAKLHVIPAWEAAS